MPKNSKKLSIGFLFDDTLDSNDGVAQYVKTLGAWLSGRGHEVSYLVGESHTKEWAGGKVYSLAKNVKVIFNGNRLSMPLPATSTDIKKLMANQHFDVLHVQAPYSPFMSQKVINASSHSTTVVGTFHVFPSGWLARTGAHLLRVFYGSSLLRIQPMLAVSPAAAGFAKEAFNLKCLISPNVVAIARFKIKNAHSSTDQSTIVFLGRLVKRKGCRQLLEAFKLLSQKMPEVRLTIAGDGPERPELEQFVIRHGLEQSVDFLGFIDEKDKPLLLAGADIACFPSLGGESFGIVLIEAMAAGAGVILGGDNEGYRGVLGAQPKLLVDANNSAVFAARLEELLTDKELASTLHSWQAQEAKRYDVATVGPQVLGIYKEAIANRSSKGHN